MKQIKTKSTTIEIIEVPKNSTNDLKHYYNLELNNNELIYTNKVLGKLSDLTDKECEEFVEFNFPFDGQSIKIYKNYYYVPLEPWDTKPWYKSAKESFISLLQSKGINTSNEDKLLIIKML